MNFSIVIAVRNRDKNLYNCLKSLSDAGLSENMEVVVVNFGGSSEAKTIVSQFKRYNLKYIYTNATFWSEAIAKNIGIRNSSGEIIACVNADIILPSNFLKELHDIYLHDSKENKYYCYQALRDDYDESGKLVRKDIEMSAPGDFQAADRKLWHVTRGYAEFMRGWGALDYDLLKRMKLAGASPKCLNRDLAIKHVNHPTQTIDFNLYRYYVFRSFINSKTYFNSKEWGSSVPSPFKLRLSKIVQSILKYILVPFFIIWNLLKTSKYRNLTGFE
jgi:glycosyltransferase involved in cell wall biosynthesis